MSVPSPSVVCPEHAVTPRSIHLLGLSGYPQDPAVVDLALERLASAGHRLDNVESTRRRYLRFAGTDSERLADLNRLADPGCPLPDIALAIRGGYGATRLLDQIDYAGLARRLREAPVALVGHSDFTAIQMALYAKAGLKSFGGPMLNSDFGTPELNAFTISNFWRTLNQPVTTLTIDAPQAQAFETSGTLWGGNLTLLASLLGTPYMPAIEGGILYVEDVNEPLFRIERVLQQLTLAGVLPRQKALVVGQFSGVNPTAYDNGYSLEAVFDYVRTRAGIPVVTGLPFGHVAEIATLPFGGQAQLAVRNDGFTLSLSDYPVLR
jgi:muramoyltetrapeptide carboxypeptidase